MESNSHGTLRKGSGHGNQAGEKTRQPNVVEERKKRRREILLVFPLAMLFLILTWIEVKLFGVSQSLPFVHSIFFFGLVNFNIILFLLLIYLIFRNVVKIFVERQGKVIGSSLKAKLIAAFVAFSFVPTVLMFLISVFYINNSFDKWFSEKMAGVLKSSLEVTNAYYLSAKRKNYHFAAQIADELKRHPSLQPMSQELGDKISGLRDKYSLDAVEFYPDLLSDRIVAVAKDESIPVVPPVSLEFLQRGVSEQVEASTIHHFEEGNLIRVVVPVRLNEHRAAIVVSSFIPLSLISQMDDIAAAYEDFRDLNPLEYPLKSIYLTILVLMTLVILLGATWFGFYLARQLSIPLEELGEATKQVAQRNYRQVKVSSGSAEISQLISHFNAMTGHLEASEKEVRQANKSLRETLSRLDEHSRYIEVVLSNITTGVVSVDRAGYITMINHHAASLLEIDPQKYIGKRVKQVLRDDYYEVFSDLLKTMRKHSAESIQKEVRISVRGRSVPLQMTLSVLYDNNKNELGKVLVFDDLSPVLRAQRAAAWTEVARRIAHEIKNPLTPIKLSAQRLQKKFGTSISDPAFDQSIAMIIGQVDSMKALVNEFNNFARLPKSNPTVASLNEIIQEALVLFDSEGKNYGLVFEPDKSLPNFKFDPEQMKRVITNLVDNSIAAVKSVKEAQITLKTQYDSLLKIVRISVTDNGIGVSEAMRDRIFEPYVTTKEHGTGLGLSIVKRMIEDHNGFVRAFSNKPQGTEVIVELPVVEAKSTRSFIKTADV